MTDKEKEKYYSSQKWLYYQDVKVLNIKVKKTEEDEKKVKEFRKFIDEMNAKDVLNSSEGDKKNG